MATNANLAKRGVYANYVDEYLRRQALTDIPQADNPASVQYNGVRQHGLTDFYRSRPTGAEAGTTGLRDIVAVPSGLPAAQERRNTNTDTETRRTNGGGGGGNSNAPYIAQLNALYDQIMNRGPFKYDLNGDLLYRQMADQYTQLGQQAMRDTMGQAAALTGGYGNSYANMVGNQAYQQYLTALNEQIPSLYDRAYNVWQGEGDRLMQQYQLAAAHPGYLAAMRPSTGTAPAAEQEASQYTTLDNPLLLALLQQSAARRTQAGAQSTAAANAAVNQPANVDTTVQTPTGEVFNPNVNPLSYAYMRNRLPRIP